MQGSLLDAAMMVFNPATLIQIFLAVCLGIVFGIIPGLTATLAVILLIPITYGMDPVTGISILIALYIGGISGGVVSAVLLGMPGTPSSIATSWDGFPLAQQGYGTKTLKAGIISNMVGTLVSWLFLIFLASEIANIALKFKSVEYVSVLIFGFVTVIALSGDSWLKGLIGCILGLVLCTIGTDPITGVVRNTFGFNQLLGAGLDPTPAMIGMFVVAEVIITLTPGKRDGNIPQLDIHDRSIRTFTLTEVKGSLWNMIRSALIGVGIGILPGLGGNIACVVAYERQKKSAKDPETYGKGNIQGVIASETANNATIGGAMIPMLALGIPGDIVTAALIGGLMLHGLQPGPLLFVDNPAFVNGIYISFGVSTLIMFAVMYIASGTILPKLLLVPKQYLMPIVLIACTVGCYNLNYNLSDMWITLFFGILGVVFTRFGIPTTPVIISMILGRMFESHLRTAIQDTRGSILPFFTQPISLLFILMTVGSSYFAWRKNREVRRRYAEAMAAKESQG